MKEPVDIDHLANIEIEKLRKKRRELHPTSTTRRRILIGGLTALALSTCIAPKAIDEFYNPYWQDEDASYLWDKIKSKNSFLNRFMEFDPRQEQERWKTLRFETNTDKLDPNSQVKEVKNRLVQVSQILNGQPYAQEGTSSLVNINSLIANNGLIEANVKSSDPFPLSVEIVFVEGVHSFILKYNPQTFFNLSPRALACWMSFADKLPYRREPTVTPEAYQTAFTNTAIFYTNLCTITKEIFDTKQSELYKITSRYHRLGSNNNSVGWKMYVGTLRQRKPFI